MIDAVKCGGCNGAGKIEIGDVAEGPVPPPTEKIDCSECHGSGHLGEAVPVI